MNAPINRIPRGLLDFLGIRSGGRNPQQLTEQLVPTFDLRDWYLESQTIEVNGNLAGFAATANAGFLSTTTTFPQNLGACVVPSNEAWLLRAGSAYRWEFSLNAGQNHFGQLVIRNTTSQAFRYAPFNYGGYSQSDAAYVRGGQTVTLSDVWLHPGEQIQVLFDGALVPAGAIINRVCLSIVRLRI